MSDFILARVSQTLATERTLETLVRQLLEMLELVTRMESTYLTRVDLEAQRQLVHDDPLVGETAAFKTRFNVMHLIARQEHNRNSLSVFLVIFDHVVPSYSVLSVYSKKKLRGLMSPDGALSLV